MCWVTAQFARRTASIFMIRGIRGWHQHSRCLLLLLHVSIHASIYILTGGIGQNYNFPPNLVDSGYFIFSHFSLHFMVWWSGQRQNWSFFFFFGQTRKSTLACWYYERQQLWFNAQHWQFWWMTLRRWILVSLIDFFFFFFFARLIPKG